MKKRYQIDQQRAVQQFRRLATEQNPNIQMILPMADIVGLLQEGVGNLLRHAGLELMHLVMDEEVKSLAGERHQQHEQRRAHRWGKEDGYCVVDGQKVPIKRTRLRSGDNREQRLGSYELFQARRAFAARRLGQDDAGTFDAQLRRGGEGLSIRLWNREVGGERELHRGQPREGEAVDGAPAGRVAVVRRAHRRHPVQGPADDCSPWDWLRWTQNRTGYPRRCNGKHRRSEQPIE